MGAMLQIKDGLRNLVANLGTSRDKASHSEYHFSQLSPEQLRAAYRSSWLPRKIINIPADDATRKWRTWQAKADVVNKLEATEKRLKLRLKVRKAIKMARLHGGSAILIGTGDKDLSKPLNPSQVAKDGLKYLTVLSKYDLTPGQQDFVIASETFGLAEDYSLTTGGGEHHTIHPSRLVIFTGAEKIDGGSTEIDPWGDSVLQAVLDAAKQTDGTIANVASLVFEAKIDTIGIPDLSSKMGDPVREAQLLERLSLAEKAKSINGTLIHDAQETVSQKSANFSQLPAIMAKFFTVVSGAADIPVTRLFGQSPDGMNATGDGDLNNYYDSIQTIQEMDIGDAMSVLDEVIIHSSLGTRPGDIFYTWVPLKQLSEKDRAEVGDKITSAFKKVVEMELLPEEAVGTSLVGALTETGVAPGLEAQVGDHFKGGGEDDDTSLLADAAPRTLYVHRKVKNADAILEWAKGQGFNTTLEADDLHVTVCFSRRPVDWLKMPTDWHGDLTVKEGGARLMEKFGEARVLVFGSDSLRWRHEDMRRAGASWDHPDYNPHITISYSDDCPDQGDVEPYQGEIILGPEMFEEIKEDWQSGLTEV